MSSSITPETRGDNIIYGAGDDVGRSMLFTHRLELFLWAYRTSLPAFVSMPRCRPSLITTMSGSPFIVYFGVQLRSPLAQV